MCHASLTRSEFFTPPSSVAIQERHFRRGWLFKTSVTVLKDLFVGLLASGTVVADRNRLTLHSPF